MTTERKRAIVEQWTADPCEAHHAVGEPGTRDYLESLLAVREEYGPWMADALDYTGASGLKVLDVGCGQGLDLVRFASAGAHVTGLDLTPRHIELATSHLRAMGLTGGVQLGDAEALPFAAESFDRVSSNGVLHHTPDITAALREVRRVLRPGGEARIVVYNKASLHYWCNQVLYEGLLRRRLLQEGSMEGVLSSGVEHSRIGGRPLVRVYTPRRIRHLMREASFNEVETMVRHLKPEDAFPLAILGRLFRSLGDRPLLDWLGRRAGWYVIARAVK